MGEDISANAFNEITLPTKTFSIENGRINGFIDEYEAMVQAIDKIMKTERFVYPIYSENYGNDLPDLIGKNFDYIKVESERMIDDALQADDRVTGVYVDDVRKLDRESVLITGTVETVFGNVDFEKGATLADD